MQRSNLSNGMVTVSAEYLSFLEQQNQLMRQKVIEVVGEALIHGRIDGLAAHSLMELAYLPSLFKKESHGVTS